MIVVLAEYKHEYILLIMKEAQGEYCPPPLTSTSALAMAEVCA